MDSAKPILIIQNCEIEGPGTIVDYLRERNLPYSVVRSYKQESLPEAQDLRAVINLGCPISVVDVPHHAFLLHLNEFTAGVIRQGIPYLGICFGGQLLARVLGAKVGPNKVREIGAGTVRLTDDGRTDALFVGFDAEFPVFQWHGDTFRVPFGASLLAEGESCKHQVFRSGNAVALQFHLEATVDDAATWCEAYAEELLEVGKTADAVMADYRRLFSEVKALNYRLLDNFFSA
jgi:GMP synthase-like glutamine amidotransferase